MLAGISKFTLLLLLTAACFFTLSSCKKEYTSSPYNQIEQFTITDSIGNELKAVIGSDNSITLYWPPFQSVPDSINPVITVADKATISPAAGKAVAFTSNTVYTVTAQDGSKQEYHLNPVINEPSPTFGVTNDGTLRLGDFLTISGEYIIADTVQTRLYLSFSNREVQLFTALLRPFYIQAYLPSATSADTGYCNIRLVTGTHTVVHGPYYIGKPVYTYNSTYSYTLKETGTAIKKGSLINFTIAASGDAAPYYSNYIGAQLSLTDNTAVYYPTELVSQTATTLQCRVPADMPTGTISRIRMYTAGDIQSPDGYLMATIRANGTTITP